MTDEEEFEKVASKVRGKMLKKDDTLFWAKYFWLESRRRFIAQLKKDSKLAGFDIEEWEDKPEFDNKCEDGTKIPDGGCFGCAESDLCR